MSRDLIFVAVSMFTWGLGEGSFLSFLPLYLEQMGARPIDIGLIFSGFGVASTVAHVPAGYLADRLGRRPLIWAAWGLGLLATIIMALSTRLPFFTGGVIIYGMSMFVLSPLYSYVTAARGNWSVGRAITLISASYNLGMMLGPLLGGELGDRYGFRSIFQVATGIFTLSILLILPIRPQPIESASRGRSTHTLLSNARYAAFLGLIFLAVFAMYLPQPLSPNFLQNQRGLNLAEIGRLYSMNGLGIVAFNLILGQANARLGFLLGQAAVGMFAVLLWIGNGMPLFLLGYFLLGGFRLARAMAIAQVRSLVHPSNMGLAYGLVETCSSLAMVLAPPLAGFLYDQAPVRVYPASLGLISLAVGSYILFLFFTRRPLLSPEEQFSSLEG